jgi:hypothetical protein
MPPPFPDKPFVGMPGSEKSVQISRESDRLICSLARHTLWFAQLVLFLFGLVLAWVAWRFWATPQGADTPLYIRIVVPFSAAGIWVLFIRNWLGPARIEILLSNGDMLFFDRRTAQPISTLHREDVAGFDLTEQFYGSLGERYSKNCVVSVSTTEGRRIALCASPDEKLMHSFASELATVLGVQLTDLSQDELHIGVNS